MGHSRDDVALSECLTSFKGKLEYVTINGMDPQLLENIVEKCSNAKLSLELDDDDALHHLRTIGKKLAKVRWEHRYDYDGDRPDLTSAWDL